MSGIMGLSWTEPVAEFEVLRENIYPKNIGLWGLIPFESNVGWRLGETIKE